MLDINLIRDQPERVRRSLRDRQMDASVVEVLLQLDEQRRSWIKLSEVLKAERNTASKEIPQMKDPDLRQGKIEEMRQVGDRISKVDGELRQVESQLNDLLAGLPNYPDPSTPVGPDDSGNVVLRTQGKLPQFDFTPKPPWGLGPRR